MVRGYITLGLIVFAVCRALFSEDKDTPKYSKNENGYYIDSQGRLIHRLESAIHDGPIPSGWVVHHVNGIKTDNNIKNLVQLPRDVHEDLHMKYGPYVPFNKEALTNMVADRKRTYRG